MLMITLGNERMLMLSWSLTPDVGTAGPQCRDSALLDSGVLNPMTVGPSGDCWRCYKAHVLWVWGCRLGKVGLTGKRGEKEILN